MFKVLIVSFDRSTLSAIKQMVAGRYDALTTNDGLTGITLLRDFKNIRAVICDSRVSNMPGPAFLQDAACIAPDATFILLAEPNTGALAQTVNGRPRFWHVVEKPVDAQGLLALLDARSHGGAAPPDGEEVSTTEEDVKRELKRIDPDHEFSMVYQPRICATSGLPRGAEAFIRWNSPVLGPVLPAQFIPVAEKTGDILWITDWTLSSACTAATTWIEGGSVPIPVSVNVSSTVCTDPRLIGLVANAVRVSGIPADLLHLEVTANLDLCRNPTVRAMVAVLRKLGVAVNIDGVMDDQNENAMLRGDHDNCLRGRHALIGRMTGPNRHGILRAIRDLGSKLGIKTIAAQIENIQHAEFVRSLGFDQMQGFHISEPLTSTDLPIWVKARSVA